MMVMASPIPIVFTSKIISQLAAPFYYATPENDWQSLIHPHIPALDDAAPARRRPVFSLRGWVPPTWCRGKAWLLALAAWQPFIWSLFLVMIAIMVVLRRQWIDNERLVYPLVQVPLAMTAMGEGNRALAALF